MFQNAYYQYMSKIETLETSSLSGGNGLDVNLQDIQSSQNGKQLTKQNNNFKCTECNVEVASAASLQAHMKQHRKFHVCVECNQQFNHSKNLQLHMQTHHGKQNSPTTLVPDMISGIKQEIKQENIDDDNEDDEEQIDVGDHQNSEDTTNEPLRADKSVDDSHCKSETT